MPVDTTSIFATVIQEHLELRRRNAALEHEMPLDRYMPDDAAFENHPHFFKTEEQARVEDTMDGMKTIVDEPTSHEWAAASESAFVEEPAAEVTADEESAVASDERPLSRAHATSTGATERPALGS